MSPPSVSQAVGFRKTELSSSESVTFQSPYSLRDCLTSYCFRAYDIRVKALIVESAFLPGKEILCSNRVVIICCSWVCLILRARHGYNTLLNKRQQKGGGGQWRLPKHFTNRSCYKKNFRYTSQLNLAFPQCKNEVDELYRFEVSRATNGGHTSFESGILPKRIFRSSYSIRVRLHHRTASCWQSWPITTDILRTISIHRAVV